MSPKPNLRFQKMLTVLVAAFFAWSGGWAIGEGHVGAIVLCLVLTVAMMVQVWKFVINDKGVV